MKANKREKLNARRKAFEDAKNKKATLENIGRPSWMLQNQYVGLVKVFQEVKTSMIKLYYQEEGMVK